MKYKQEIHEYINAHKDEITKTLKEIIKIPSIRGGGCAFRQGLCRRFGTYKKAL